jgi:protein phosphatase
MGMRLTAGGCTAIGRRATNEDADFVDLDVGLLVVADGMGGHKAGEVASRMAIDAVVRFVRETHGATDLTWPFPTDASRSTAANRVLVAIRLANRSVHEAGLANPRYSGMGTTIVVALVDGDRLVIGHAGDTRAYCRTGVSLEQVTEDDTWLNVMKAAGARPRDQDQPFRHVLTRGVGMRADLVPSIVERPLVVGDRWLICTDGVHGVVEPVELSRALEVPSAQVAARQVVLGALAAGTSDNATAVVLYAQ